MKPRAYQIEATRAIFDALKRKENPLVVAPTGSGKSHILGYFCQQAYQRYPAEAILILTHRKEIIQQNANILRQYLPIHLVGIYSSGVGYKQTRQFTVAGIQSIYKQASKLSKYKLIIVDEAHLIPPSGEGRYRTLFNTLGNPAIVGLTATPFRLGHGLLTDNHMFDAIAYSISIADLIDKKYLAPLICKSTEYQIDVSNVKTIAGDYSKKDLSLHVDNTVITNTIVKKLVRYKDIRKAWLVFAIDIEHCEHIAEQLQQAGIIAVAVHSRMNVDRQLILDMFKAGNIQAIVSVETLTTGFDAPTIDLIALLRPTQSPVLHVQMLGRGMRIHENKTNCLVLDFAGNVRALGPVDAVTVTAKKKGKGSNKNGFTRICPECAEIVHISKKQCTACGFTFPVKPTLYDEAQEAPILKQQGKIWTAKVNKINATIHKKVGKVPSLKITYYNNMFGLVSEWVTLEHKGYPRKRAVDWWSNNAKGRIPDTVQEAFDRRNEIRIPTQLTIEKYGKYPSIIKRSF